MAVAPNIPGIELGEELGRGSYSVVYRGRLGDRACAVKLPLVGGAWTRWVYREAVALARVRHPGLATVLEVGECDRIPYIATDLIEGETLDERLRRGPLLIEQVIEHGIELASALAAVHSVGLIHRDVKPGNIVLATDGHVRLIDFGFAVPFEAASRSDERAGTRGYSAPEQMVPMGRVDGRSDLFALGRVLRECLVGRGPKFVGELELTGLETVAPRLVPVLDGLVAMDPADRYPDAAAVLKELTSVAQGDNALGPRGYVAELRTPSLVGRRAVTDRLNRSWLSAGVSSGRVVLLKGSRGMGKTSLLQASAVLARASGNRCVLDVACQENEAPLSTLRRIFQAFVTSWRGPEGRTAESAIGAALDERLSAFAHLLGIQHAGADAAQNRTAEAAPGGFAEGAAELLVRLARSAGPIVLFVDDLQWIDPASRDSLVSLASRTGDASLSVVLAVRATGTSPPGLDALLSLGPSRVETIELAGFGRSEVAESVARHLGTDAVLDPLVHRIVALADGTPLGVMEVIGTFLDSGALRPHVDGWRFDGALAESIVLPHGAWALLGRRLTELPPATRSVLEAAAVLGASFDETRLAKLVGVESRDLAFAMLDALQAGVVTSTKARHYGFVHASVREQLLEMLPKARGQKLHQRAAESIDDGSVLAFDDCCAAALHYANGETDKTPQDAYRVAREAARAALERFDNESTLRFLGLARAAATLAGLALDAAFERCAGEASLRLGILDQSERSFEAAKNLASGAEERAVLLGRLAWLHQVRAEPERAWDALGQAFSSVGATMPVDSATSTALQLGTLAQTQLRAWARRAPTATGPARTRVELLCDLHYQNARLGGEYARPLRAVQSTMEALRLSASLGPSRARARALTFYGFFLATLGLRDQSKRELHAAEQIARTIADPTTQAFCIQIQAVAACFTGELDAALALLHTCVETYGPWLELNEYCLDAATGDHIESVRGRPAEALAWSDRATLRQRRLPFLKAGSAELLACRARAAYASCGRELSPDVHPLTAKESPEGTAALPKLSFYEEVSWGPRARFLFETGAIGNPFDALLKDFRSRGYNPRTLHPTVAELYITAGHAFIHRLLRSHGALDAARADALRGLRAACDDLTAPARIPLYRAHRLFFQGALAWFDGSTREAGRLLGEAQTLAETETCPWVVSEVARIRAHMLRAAGKEPAALDQGRFAQLVAREHGALPRARRIREELALPASHDRRIARSSVHSSIHARRQLTMLLQAVQTSFTGMTTEQQARIILTGLVADLAVDRGVLVLQRASALGITEPIVVLDRGRPMPEPWPEDLARSVSETGIPWPPDDGLASDDGAARGTRALIFPLFLHTRVVGAVCVERRASAPPFREDERELLLLLSHQVAVALETTRLLAERDKLQSALVRSQRLEAVGRLAGSIAHDVNSMLAATRLSIEIIQAQEYIQVRGNEDIQLIDDTTRRATEVAQRLLSFSRHQPVAPKTYSMSAILVEMRPILARLLGPDVHLKLDPLASPHLVRVDRASLEQALVNLAINAREAMPERGTFSITTMPYAASHDGRGYLRMEVADDGVGMPPEVLGQVFEPFFTTKPPGRGTGLGLASVYAFVRNSGGNIDVSSEVGQGTVFHIDLPLAEVAVVDIVPPIDGAVVSSPRKREGRTILIVDDDQFTLQMMDRVLTSQHHQVIITTDAAEALRVVDARGDELGLVVLDVLMPTMGPELGKQIALRQPHLPQLFISGFSPQPVKGQGLVEFLQKPFSSEELLGRVEHILGEIAPAG